MTNGMHERGHRGAESNGLGLAGFIVSLLGLVGTCGLLSPIGLVLSLIGLGRQPRGFAIAGTIIGAVGSIWVVGVVLVVGVVGFAMAVAALAVALGATAAIVSGALDEGAGAVYAEIQEHYEANGRVPYALTELTDLRAEQLNDKWGRPLVYEPETDGKGFTLRSLGEDGQEGTGDDWRVSYNFETKEFTLDSEYADFNWD